MPNDERMLLYLHTFESVNKNEFYHRFIQISTHNTIMGTVCIFYSIRYSREYMYG